MDSKFNNLSIRQAVLLGIVLSLVLTLPILIWGLLTQNLDIRKEASTSSPTVGVGSVTLVPATASHYVGDTFSVDIFFQTGTNATDVRPISSITLRLTYPYSSATPELEPGSAQVTLNQDLLLTGDWSFPINSITQSGGLVTIELAAINTNIAGFSSITSVRLGTIDFTVNEAIGDVTLTFDQAQSRMMTKDTPVEDILFTPTNGIYTLSSDDLPPATISDLQVTTTTYNSANLSWTSPSDQGPGSVASYDFRYSDVSLNESNWNIDGIIATGTPTPSSPGSTETIAVSNLAPGNTYYFAVRSIDDSGNISGVSNVASTTTDSSTLTFGVRLQGVSGTAATSTSQFDLTFENTGQSIQRVFSNNLTLSPDGVYRTDPSIDLGDLPVLTYDVFINASSHLRRTLGSFSVQPGPNNAPAAWESTELLAGDFDGNNILNIIDIGQLLSVYTALSIPVTQANQNYDIDMNGTIDILDIALVLSNYTALEVSGD